MATWPDTLPQQPLVEGFSGTVQDTLIRTSMDAGPEKIRRRFTAASEYFTLTWFMTKQQLNTFISFFNNDIAGGSLEFEMVHPLTSEPALMRFRGVYKISLAGTGYLVNAEIEVLP